MLENGWTPLVSRRVSSWVGFCRSRSLVTQTLMVCSEAAVKLGWCVGVIERCERYSRWMDRRRWPRQYV